MGIKHADVKATGDKGYASEWNKDHTIDGNVDVNKKQLLCMAIENRTDYPAGPVAGQVIYRTDLLQFMVYDGTGWHSAGKRVQYYSVPGCEFKSVIVAAGDAGWAKEAAIDNTGGCRTLGAGADTDNIGIAPVHLPDGAVVTAAIVYGDSAAYAWYLVRVPLNACGPEDVMADQNEGTEDTSIDYATIDNSAYKYFFYAECGPNHVVRGARIKYTV